MRLQEPYGMATKATLEDIDAPQFLSLHQSVRNTTEIIIPAALRPSPLDCSPLQQVVWHSLTMLVSRSSEQIPAPASQRDSDGSRNCLPITLSQQEYATVLLTKHAQNILIVCLVMNEELITRTGGLVD